MNNLLRTIILSFALLLLTGCGGGSSSSGVEPSIPGENTPAIFVGVYKGTLNLTAEAIGIKESDSFSITVTVFENGTVRFDGDDPEETFTVGLTDDGNFSGNIEINEEECSGTIGVTGVVDGTSVSGTVQGDGECTQGGVDFDVELSGDFLATK